MRRRWPDLDVLELLVGVDDHGSLSAASRNAGMAQPNGSRAIKQLERQLGMPLLDRRTTGSTLTPQGTVVVHWARRLLDEAHRLLDVADGLRAERSAELTIGASMTVAEHLLPGWLGRFRGLDADVTIHLQVLNSTQVFERLESGACDVGFVESPTLPRGLHSVTVARDELVVVVHPGHPWTRRRKPITVAELAQTPLVVREPGSGTRTTLDVALQDLPRTPPLLELGSAAAIRTSIIAGVGPAVMSTLAVADQVAAGELTVVDVDGLVLERSLRAVWRGPRQLSGPAGDLVRMVRRSGAG
ncbi:LysR family transcriptional regulator [Prescottella equi]|uniref:LysR family transcriptional regulator n=1 Tax=Rhodococcus hoagii TaxID=43767 RepID=UPI0009BD94FE|nr:LysR family transcriptional regulator [Prescottella equi]OQQ33161.1 LysR family transcriptional regulator [Prescottella equi]